MFTYRYRYLFVINFDDESFNSVEIFLEKLWIPRWNTFSFEKGFGMKIESESLFPEYATLYVSKLTRKLVLH